MDNPEEQAPYVGLPSRSEVEVSAAVRDCVRKCLENGRTRDCVEAFMSALITDGWAVKDANEVRISALKVLVKLTGDNSFWPD
jgi:hypothetical protein